MIKVSPEKLICTPEQSLRLVQLGVIKACMFAYEKVSVKDCPDTWEFIGEWMGDENNIPAWTMEELAAGIGSGFWKPDLFGTNDYTSNANMMQYALYLNDRKLHFTNGAQAYAQQLIHMIENRYARVECVNERLTALAEDGHYNPFANGKQMY